MNSRTPLPVESHGFFCGDSPAVSPIPSTGRQHMTCELLGKPLLWPKVTLLRKKHRSLSNAFWRNTKDLTCSCPIEISFSVDEFLLSRSQDMSKLRPRVRQDTKKSAKTSHLTHHFPKATIMIGGGRHSCYVGSEILYPMVRHIEWFIEHLGYTSFSATPVRTPKPNQINWNDTQVTLVVTWPWVCSQHLPGRREQYKELWAENVSIFLWNGAIVRVTQSFPITWSFIFMSSSCHQLATSQQA